MQRLHSEAAFARLCGVAPIPVSSGKTHRMRLHRGGDRQANAALHMIAVCRMRYHQPTIDYVKRRLADGLSKKDVLRCLSNRSWLVWCPLAGWLPVLLDVTPAASGPSSSDGAFRLTCPSGGAGAGLSSYDGLIEGRPGCHL
ncbi:transposase [Arthrobacter bambusae]|uniref:transposase n=1 Tax=Arthrobacter bambusae TaxID=1338426 RepID=UPI0027D8B755|nr:transposase [Arthrobacter bambusae]